MAGEKGYIDEIIGSKGIDGIDKAIAKLDVLADTIKRISNQSISLKIGESGGSSNTIKQLSEQDKLVEKLTRTTNNYGSEIERLKAKISEASKENKIYAKEQAGLLNSYDKLVIAHKKAERAALDAGVQHGLLSKEWKEASASANTMYNQLTRLEQALGNHKRGVGQYTNAVFGLSQVLREMPAFTYSAQMGIMALGNNLPILADNFKAVMKSTNEATGKVNGFAGALGIFAKSIFSFVNIFTIAIGLFTIFYDEIFKGTESLEKFTESLDNGTKASMKASNEVEALREKIRLAKEGVYSKDEALKLYNETIGKTIGEVKDWGELENRMIDDAARFIKVQELKARSVDALTESINLRKKADSLQEGDLGFIDKLKSMPFIPTTALKMMFNSGGAMMDIANAQQAYKDNIIKELKELAAAKKLTFEILELKIAELSRGFTGKSSSGKASTSSASGGKEINRVADLREQYEKENKEAELAHKKGETSYIEYQIRLLKIAEKYSDLRKKVLKGETENEKKSGLDFDLELVNAQLGAIEEARNAATKVFKESLYTGKDASKNIQELAKTVKLVQGNISVDLGKEKTVDYRQLSIYIQEIGDALLSFSNISDALFEREMQRFDLREKRLGEVYDNEMRFIEQSGLSAEKKEKRKQQIERETEAARKKLDRERTTALIKQAKLNKAFAISDVIFNTASAIMVALTAKEPISRAIQVAAAITTGSTQLLKVALAPLPQYAKGRKGGQAEWAVVSEEGQEARRSKDGTISLLPKSKSVVYLNEGDDVITHRELIKSKAYIELSKSNKPINTMDLQVALLNAFDENTKEIKQLQAILIGKKFTVPNNEELMWAYKKQYLG